MANKKLSQLTTKGSLSDTDIIPIVDGAGTKKVTAATVKTYATSGLSTSNLTNDSGFITSNVSADIIPTTDNAVDLGSPTNRFRHLYVAPGTIYLGDIKLTNLNGKLDAKKVKNPGEENEEEDETDSDAFSDLRGGPGLGDFTIAGSILEADEATIRTNDGDLTLESDSDVFVKSSGGTRQWKFNNLGGIELPGIEGSNYNIGETEGGLQLSSGYDFYINTNNNTINNRTWSFQADGILKLPAGGDIVDATGTSVLGGGGGGDITFDGSKLSSPSTGSGDFPNGVITLAPGNVTDNYYANNGQFINIYPTNAYDSPHIHIAPGSGSGGTGDLILGDDNQHIDINHNGSIYVRTNNQSYSWEFDPSGNFRLPSGGDILDSSGNSVVVSSMAEPRFDLYANTLNIGTIPNRRYAVDTTLTPTTIYLPSSPQPGDTFFVADAGGAFATSNLTISRNGMTINGEANDIVLNTNGDSIGMFWNGNTWRLYE